MYRRMEATGGSASHRPLMPPTSRPGGLWRVRSVRSRLWFLWPLGSITLPLPLIEKRLALPLCVLHFGTCTALRRPIESMRHLTRRAKNAERRGARLPQDSTMLAALRSTALPRGICVWYAGHDRPGGIAQSAEQLTFNQCVLGSSPSAPTPYLDPLTAPTTIACGRGASPSSTTPPECADRVGIVCSSPEDSHFRPWFGRVERPRRSQFLGASRGCSERSYAHAQIARHCRFPRVSAGPGVGPRRPRPGTCCPCRR